MRYSNLTANNIDTATNIASYTNTPYTAPSDGYLYVHSGTLAGSIIKFAILGATNDNSAISFLVTPVQNLGSSTAVFVRKGMRIKILEISSDGAGAYFKPLVS